jgi:hypothetical protein
MSTLVSNFELLFKPLTPGLSPELATLGRRALQGYFLSITNLESSTLTYTLEYRVSLPEPGAGAVGRRDLSHAVFISDVAGDNQFAVPTFNGGNLWTNNVTIPGGKTALTLLLPNVGVEGFFSGPSDVEVRGHVRLALNCRRCRIKPGVKGFLLGLCPQATEPTRVLASVEHRTTFLPNGWPMVADEVLDFDQVGTSIALAQGRGEFTVTPRTHCARLAKPVGKLTPEALEAILQGPGVLGRLGEEAQAEALLETMALMADQGEEEARMVEALASRMGLESWFQAADKDKSPPTKGSPRKGSASGGSGKSG